MVLSCASEFPTFPIWAPIFREGKSIKFETPKILATAMASAHPWIFGEMIQVDGPHIFLEMGWWKTTD